MEKYAILKEDQSEMQRTVSNILYFKGIGLHTGKESQIIIKPAKADSGITFVRKDLTLILYFSEKSPKTRLTFLIYYIFCRFTGSAKVE